MTLVVAIGGIRSGKSAWAEAQAQARCGEAPVTVLATADPADGSMDARIARHQQRRPAGWRLREVHGSDDLAGALPERGVALLDGLGGWVAGLLARHGAFDDDRAAAAAATGRASERAHDAIDALIRAADAPGRTLVLVTDEAGLGVLPLGAGTAAWVDLLGELNQRLAAAAQLAVLVVAGRALLLPADRPAPDGAADDAGALAALRSHGDQLVRPGDADHAVNIAAQGPPAWLTEALQGVLDGDGVVRYPDATAAEAALARVYGRDPAEVVATNGAAQALWLLPAALRPTLAACVHPLFTEAEAALRAHGVPVARVHRDPERDFALDPAAVPEQADLVVLGNPAAASGTLAGRETIRALRRPGRTIVVDEAFMDFVPGEPESLARERDTDVVVVRSFTKSLSMPGVRCGAALAAAPLAARLRAVQPPWSVNAFALTALVALADHPDELPGRAARATAECADLAARLGELSGVRLWPSRTNHLLVRVADGRAVAERLRAAGIAVRPCGSFPGLTDDELRVTARDAQANASLTAAFERALHTTGAAA